MPRLISGLAIALAPSCVALAGCTAAPAARDTHVDAFPRLVAEAGMRIGDVEDPDIGFSRVVAVDVDRDGNVYVLEALVPEIRVYSPDGALLRRIGRRGAGPGEFESTPHFGVVGDTVWAVTYAPDRITLFNRDGTLLSARRSESVVVPLPRSYGYVLPWMMRPDGKFTSRMARIAGLTAPPSGVQPTDSIPVPFVLFDATGAVVDTIGWAPRPPPQVWSPASNDDDRYRTIEVAGRRQIVPSPPPTRPWQESLQDGYVLVDAPTAEASDDGTFTVARFGLTGDTVYTRTLHYRPARYSSADLDSIAARAARGEAGGMAPFMLTRGSAPTDWEIVAHSLRDAMDFPEFKPAIERPWFAQDESVWLLLTGGAGGTARWVLLDERGRPRGQLELPPNVRVLWSRGDTFWAVKPDEQDVPWLVQFRIRPG